MLDKQWWPLTSVRRRIQFYAQDFFATLKQWLIKKQACNQFVFEIAKRDDMKGFLVWLSRFYLQTKQNVRMLQVHLINWKVWL